MPNEEGRQDALYGALSPDLAAAIERIARGYEADEARRQDLVQDIHVALWRSFAGFDGRCALRTWVYRVGHNVGVSHVLKDRKGGAKKLVGLEELEGLADPVRTEHVVERRQAMERLLSLVRRLKPIDRQVILLFLEGEEAAAIAEITGLSPANVATKIHRTKKILTSRFEGESNE